MLRLVSGDVHDRVVWEREDVRLMAKVLGADSAVKLKAPYNPSILKLARHYQIPMGKAAITRLSDEIEFRLAHGYLKKEKDAPSIAKHEELFQPHQRADLAYMRRTQLPSYLLAHHPGVGKTLMAIQHVNDVKASRILVITPNSAKEQWHDEIIRWSRKQLPIHIVQGKTLQQCQIASMARGWIIGHWESLVHAREGYLHHPYDIVIADEAHHAQNRKAKRTDTLFDIEAALKLALTAHPYSKRPSDFFAILRFLYPETYSSYWRFWDMHVDAVPKPFGGFEVKGSKRPKLLKWEIAPFTLRRTKFSLGWAPVARIKRVAHLTPRGLKEYGRLKKQFFAELDALGGPKTVVIPSQLARLMRLRQYLIDPALLGGEERSVKYPIIAEIMEEIDGPPVIFTQFKQAAIKLGVYLKARGYKRIGFIYGHMKLKKNEVKWQFLDGKFDALIVVMESGGEALNLGKYGYVIYLDLPWHPRGLEQTEGRVDRPEEGTGKRVQVTSFRVVVADAYEEKMEKRIEDEHEDFGRVFTVGKIKELFG